MIEISVSNIDEVIASFEPAIVSKVARATLSKVATSGRAIAVEDICSVWNIKQADVMSKIKITQPRLDNLVATLSFYGDRGISLSYFNPKQLLGMRGENRRRNGNIVRVTYSSRSWARRINRGPQPIGVAITLKKGGQQTILQNSFLAKMRSSHIGVMRRKSNTTMPARARWSNRPHAQQIEEKGLISIATLVQEPRVFMKVKEKIEARGLEELPRQLEYFQSRANR